jgi:hypothetical protein
MKGIIFSVCVMIFSWGEMAVAGPFYDMGKNASVDLAKTAWNNLGEDCNKIDAFAQIVEDGIRDTAREIETSYRGHFAKDFAVGYQDGLSSVLNQVRDKCPKAMSLLERLKQLVKKLFKLFLAEGTIQEPRPYKQAAAKNLR